MTWRSPDDPAWLALSARLQRTAAMVARRSDIVVTVRPGIGPAGWSAEWRPDQGEIAIDARAVLADGDDPRAVRLDDEAARTLHPRLVGVLVQNAGHAAHTRALPPPATPSWLAAGRCPRSRPRGASPRGRASVAPAPPPWRDRRARPRP